MLILARLTLVFKEITLFSVPPFGRGFLGTMERAESWTLSWLAEERRWDELKLENGQMRRREEKKIARLHSPFSNENLFLPFSFHPTQRRRLFNFMQGKGERVAFESQVRRAIHLLATEEKFCSVRILGENFSHKNAPFMNEPNERSA